MTQQIDTLAPGSKIVLDSCPNPDFGECQKPAPGYEIEVASFALASFAARTYIEEFGLGAGNWAGGDITDPEGNALGRVSYNGRVWVGETCVYEPH